MSTSGICECDHPAEFHLPGGCVADGHGQYGEQDAIDRCSCPAYTAHEQPATNVASTLCTPDHWLLRSRCGMRADADPRFHLERYAHWPTVTGASGEPVDYAS